MSDIGKQAQEMLENPERKVGALTRAFRIVFDWFWALSIAEQSIVAGLVVFVLWVVVMKVRGKRT